MNAVERVKMICKERKIPISKLESDCGFSNGYIGQLRKGTFPDDRLHIISKYLDVSTTFLTTGEQPEFTVEMAETDLALSNMEKRLKTYALKLSELPKDKQEQIMSLIDMLSDK